MHTLGGSWSAPPDAAPGWESSELGAEWAAAAAETMLSAYPEDRPAVVKDPRMCLLLPFWLRVIGRPAGVLYLWRDPVAVARSVSVRSRWPLTLGLSLWERYNRDALNALAGQNVFMLSYDELMSDPAGFAASAASWLRTLGATDTAAATAVPECGLQHFRSENRQGDGLLLPAHLELIDAMASAGGQHESFVPPPLPDPTPWADGIVELRRNVELGELCRAI